MKKALWIAALITSLVLGLVALAFNFASSPKALELPNLKLERLTNESVMLSDYKGKPVVINLWASWCGPCKRELPMMHAMAKQNPDVTFLFISQRESQTKVQEYLSSETLELKHVLLDPKGVTADLFQSRGLPSTLFFDASGHVVEAHLGELSSVKLFNSVNTLKR